MTTTITKTEFLQNKQYRRLNLIKTDKNGTEYYEGECPCPRCNGEGKVYIGVLNGKPIPATPDGGVCWKCGGTSTVYGKVKVITEEYAKILEAKQIDKKVKSVEDAEKRIAENKQKTIQYNLNLGLKEVNFEVADWFKDSNIRFGWKYYLIAKETEKAYLLKFTNLLDMSINNMHEIWVPKKAIIFKGEK